MPEMRPILCYVTDRRALPAAQPEAALLELVRRAIAANIDWIQIREKDFSGSALAALTRACVAAAGGTATRILVNDRLDIAAATGAAGVHLGGESLPVRDVADWCRKQSSPTPERASPLLSRDFLIGRSCHSLEEARAAEADGASYLIFGPIFATPSKAQYGEPQGVQRLAAVCRGVKIPVLAIGGITLENAGDCFSAGAAGIAAIRLFQGTADLSRLEKKLRARALMLNRKQSTGTSQ